jgi:hypothetical protein
MAVIVGDVIDEKSIAGMTDFEMGNTLMEILNQLYQNGKNVADFGIAGLDMSTNIWGADEDTKRSWLD